MLSVTTVTVNHVEDVPEPSSGQFLLGPRSSKAISLDSRNVDLKRVEGAAGPQAGVGGTETKVLCPFIILTVT